MDKQCGLSTNIDAVHDQVASNFNQWNNENDLKDFTIDLQSPPVGVIHMQLCHYDSRVAE